MIEELFTDERCSQAILDFLATMGGRPPVAEGEEAAANEASEWETRERDEHLAALREEEDRLGGMV